MPSTKKASAAMEINLFRETNYFGTATYSSTIDLGFLWTVFPLTLARSGPNITRALDTSVESIGQFYHITAYHSSVILLTWAAYHTL